jgi:hypothetical protein
VLDPILEDALERAVDGGVTLVLAAGNEGALEPTFPARFAADAQADGLAIAVGSVDANNQLAASSNRAGSAQDHYLVAPGVGILAPAPGGVSALFSGTSAAAPHVAGAAAVVLQAAPFLSGTQVVELLLDTAHDLGDVGTDPEYGRGLVDLDAALSPQGALAVPRARRSKGQRCRWMVPACASARHSGPAQSSAGRYSSTVMAAPTGWISTTGPSGSLRCPNCMIGWRRPGGGAPSAPSSGHFRSRSVSRARRRVRAPERSPSASLRIGTRSRSAPRSAARAAWTWFTAGAWWIGSAFARARRACSPDW